MVSLFFSQHNGVFSPSTLLIVIFWVSSLPISVTTHSNSCLHTNYFAEWSYCRHTPPLEAWLWTCPLQWRWHCRWRLISQWHRTSIPSSCYWKTTRQNSSWIIIWRWLADSAIRPGSLYDGAALITPDDGNTLRASVRSQRWCPYYSILRLRLENSFHLCHSIHF